MQPATTAGPAAAGAKGAALQATEEYLPPNKILFIQNLPDSTTKEDLEELFKPYANLHDVRMIPGRKGIAFVEFIDEASSTVAKDALHNHRVDDEHKMKVGRGRCANVFSACMTITASDEAFWLAALAVFLWPPPILPSPPHRSHSRSSDEAYRVILRAMPQHPIAVNHDRHHVPCRILVKSEASVREAHIAGSPS